MNLLKETQEMIASPEFRYGGNSMDIMDIVDAIKSGYRLCRVDDAICKMNKVGEREVELHGGLPGITASCIRILEDSCE